jgi:structure-specific endonuclease subunit SLX1
MSILSNLHLLLRVPSFVRWPLKLHFFVPDVHSAWEGWCATASEPIRPGLVVATEFGPNGNAAGEGGIAGRGSNMVDEGGRGHAQPWGIQALALDYEPIRDYVTKGRAVFGSEREGGCVVCGDQMAAGEGLYVLCPNAGCEGVGHLSCWSRHVLPRHDSENILPVEGRCPKCGGEVEWGDMMKELTLRVRGKKVADKLLRKRRVAEA